MCSIDPPRGQRYSVELLTAGIRNSKSKHPSSIGKVRLLSPANSANGMKTYLTLRIRLLLLSAMYTFPRHSRVSSPNHPNVKILNTIYLSYLVLPQMDKIA